MNATSVPEAPVVTKAFETLGQKEVECWIPVGTGLERLRTELQRVPIQAELIAHIIHDIVPWIQKLWSGHYYTHGGDWPEQHPAWDAGRILLQFGDMQRFNGLSSASDVLIAKAHQSALEILARPISYLNLLEKNWCTKAPLVEDYVYWFSVPENMSRANPHECKIIASFILKLSRGINFWGDEYCEKWFLARNPEIRLALGLCLLNAAEFLSEILEKEMRNHDRCSSLPFDALRAGRFFWLVPRLAKKAFSGLRWGVYHKDHPEAQLHTLAASQGIEWMAENFWNQAPTDFQAQAACLLIQLLPIWKQHNPDPS